MTKGTKQYSQIFDEGIKSGIIAQIGEKVLALLAALACFMNKDGQCYPKESTLGKILGKSERTIAQWVATARKTKYRNVPVITAIQNKKIVHGKWEFSSNQYVISAPIREDLISRYYSVGRNPHTENNKVNQDKTHLPQAEFPSSEKLPTNDIPSVNNIYNNDKRQSLINKFSFKGTTLTEFSEQAQSGEDYRCLEIAEWLGEEHINFILSARKNPKCGMNGIDWAFSTTKDQHLRNKAQNKRKLFNFYIQQYKQDE